MRVVQATSPTKTKKRKAEKKVGRTGIVGDKIMGGGGGFKGSNASPARPSGTNNMNIKIYEKKKALE